MTEFERLRAELADAVARGDEAARRVLEEELRGHVRQLLQSDLEAARELAALLQEERSSPGQSAPASGGVTFSNNTFHGPVLGSGTQFNAL
ncbi:hypothetical protein [Streptomyces sp. G45]|uniref:hypothetical protein n=1 Tax=Streptomyces sp. G45 TaxID=3406627 RepID=UPI003C250DEB